MRACGVILVTSTVLAACGGTAPTTAPEQPQREKGSVPIVIAHRGASGYLPEHTSEAKALAHGMGADFIEQDVVLTRDNAAIVLHDVQIDTVTDVASRFPNRRRADGRFYAIDFDLAEIASVTSRLISSGIVRSKLRNPASRCATGSKSFFATSAAAAVEFTSPTTTT